MGKLGLRQREKLGSEMRESQCLETDLNLIKDLMGRWRRISLRRSSLSAIISAEYDGGEELELVAVMASGEALLVLSVDDISNHMKGN